MITALMHEYTALIIGNAHDENREMYLQENSEKPCNKSKLDESIRDEYSTMAVDGIDKTDPVVEILKEYVPEDKFIDTVDMLCNSL